MKNNYTIKSPRQRRALEALLAYPEGIPCKDLGPIIGALNPRQTVMELRRQGFHDAIVTELFETRDRDGRRCRPGSYLIPSTLHEWVHQALNENATGSDGAKPMADDSSVDYDDNIGGLPCQ